MQGKRVSQLTRTNNAGLAACVHASPLMMPNLRKHAIRMAVVMLEVMMPQSKLAAKYACSTRLCFGNPKPMSVNTLQTCV